MSIKLNIIKITAKINYNEEFINKTLRIVVIGDYDGRPSHLATNEAIRHCASYLGLNKKYNGFLRSRYRMDT